MSEQTFCNATHFDTGAVCELPPGHEQNHRGQFDNGIAQWPKSSPSSCPSCAALQEQIEKLKAGLMGALDLAAGEVEALQAANRTAERRVQELERDLEHALDEFKEARNTSYLERAEAAERALHYANSQVVILQETRSWAHKERIDGKRCILDVDSPSYPPESEEYWMCRCRSCVEHIVQATERERDSYQQSYVKALDVIGAREEEIKAAERALASLQQQTAGLVELFRKEAMEEVTNAAEGGNVRDILEADSVARRLRGCADLLLQITAPSDEHTESRT